MNKNRLLLRLLRVKGPNCYYCERNIDVNTKNEYNSATIDHVVPKNKNGRNNLDNLVPCCAACNSIKSNMSEKAFKAQFSLAKENEKFFCYMMQKSEEINKRRTLVFRKLFSKETHKGYYRFYGEFLSLTLADNSNKFILHKMPNQKNVWMCLKSQKEIDVVFVKIKLSKNQMASLGKKKDCKCTQTSNG